MAEFQGNLYIFVDAFREAECAPPAREPHEVFGADEPGEMLWYLTGWAVGKNARGSYCARTSSSKLRSFNAITEAIDFVRKKRKARPAEQFYLVYEVGGRKSIVTSLEQILRLDGHLDGAAHRTHGDMGSHPKFDALTERVGKIVATNALMLLKTLDQEGEAAARTRFSIATYERLWRVLRDADMVEGLRADS